MTEKKMVWTRVADHPNEIGWNENGIGEVDYKGKTICMAKYKDQLFACAAKCPHAGGHLADGYIDAMGNIVCPLHRYKFSLANGRNTSGEGYYLKNWPVEVREDGVYIGTPETGSFWNIFG